MQLFETCIDYSSWKIKMYHVWYFKQKKKPNKLKTFEDAYNYDTSDQSINQPVWKIFKPDLI